ncbi:MAG: 1,4-alpha-glucan branching protein GlgB [Candidatus Omnitrophica bacterium]|nr:1,4-alpha-glucan branching protein GlgB [Candidatus Omnitrophota bacterium]
MADVKNADSKILTTEQNFITEHDIYLFREGNHYKLYEKLGSHLIVRNGKAGVHFAVWAPNAESVSVIGDFNGWAKGKHPLSARWDSSGIWEGFIEGLEKGTLYKYSITSKNQNYSVEKRDPYAFFNEVPPKTASIVWDLENEWTDQSWMKKRQQFNALDKPMSIYEIHLGSWRRIIEENNRYCTYRELAKYLVDYIKATGFTHVEFLPVMEHPFYGSWGYQSIGYFAPTNRYGTPQDFMFLIDALHQNNIGVILDWVPSHFPSDEHGLVYFDGTNLFEHTDKREGFHPDWKSYIFNLGRQEVKEFLISSAVFWLDKYHVDGLRVDAVASMLYRDYSRKEGEWIPNKYGGRENLESIEFLKQLNKTVYEYFPDTQVTAEESTAWPGVSRPLYLGGLGFGMKWNMGWMHDTLSYFAEDPVFRKYHHGELTFSYLYAFTENFVLSLSHDEVVHGKGSLINKMPGDQWQKFANLRLLYGYMFTHPGKKLLFMGCEFGQWDEWNHEKSLDWHLLQYPAHAGILQCVKDLNNLYKTEPALYQTDFLSEGFHCVDSSDSQQSVISFLRKTQHPQDDLLIVCNFTPALRCAYRVGVPQSGYWREILNTDANEYGGSGHGNMGGQESDPVAIHGFYHSLALTLPPLSIVVLKKSQ